MKTKFFVSILLIICTAIIISACYKNKTDYNNSPSGYKITMKNSVFSPASLTVVAGSTITWTNDDNMIHAVTATDGSFNSGDIAIGSSYSKTFSTVGTINYSDSHNTSMTGVLIVTGSTGGGY
ncbi:MAG TPA: cupredoxin domain-containing protein [Chitinophagaceae bacterium]|jgi:plastocyanin|nr:cupredoxin domain-containing protein [Chitinophagaceae bacterium]